MFLWLQESNTPPTHNKDLVVYESREGVRRPPLLGGTSITVIEGNAAEMASDILSHPVTVIQ